MNFWRKLFPKYNCRRCKDTLVVYGQYFIARCDCPGSIEATRRASEEFWKKLQE